VITALALTLAAVGVVLGGYAAVLASTDRPRSANFRLATNALEAGLLVQLLGAIVGLVKGHTPDEMFTFLAYAITSVALLPILVTTLASDDQEWGGPRWPNTLTAVACIAAAVVVLRMQATWPANGA
jgi:hypothetical protein